MIISIIQPCFVPWLGYFEQIALSDIFVYLDDVKYSAKNWRNNNQLKSPNGVKGISVSVNKPPIGTPINKVSIAYHLTWREKLLNQLSNWYGNTPYFGEVMEIITAHLRIEYANLAEFNIQLNQRLLDYLGISTSIFRSSKIPHSGGDKVQRIAEICSHFSGVKVLFDGKSAQNFLSRDSLKEQGVTIVFQNYKHIEYPQKWGIFTPYMSILDCLFNCGQTAINYLVSEESREKLNAAVPPTLPYTHC